MMRLYRTTLLLVGGGGLLIGILLVFVLALSWSNTQRLQSLSEHLGYYAELRAAYGDLSAMTGQERVAVLDRSKTADVLRELAARPAALVPDTVESIVNVTQRLEAGAPASADSIRAELDTILDREAAAYRALLHGLQQDDRREFQAVFALGIVLPVLGIALLVFFHRRVLTPLSDLSIFLSLLARKDYAVAATENVDLLVRPLFEKYNRMVKRMHDLEQGHQKREDSLRQDVDQATRALFQQQAALLRMERLAAVGEVSARLGHELRNPLSGVLMALTNLRSEIDSEDQDQRLGLAIAELERIANLLTRVVEESRQVPERPRSLHLQTLVDEMASLVRYQLDDSIALETEVPVDLYCTLPESGFRQALLNLVLNAAQALDGGPGAIRIGAERQAETLVISVCDDGPGFPQELLDAGVHEFGSWRHGGTGLGLATVRRFAFANSGRLQLSNRAGSGACATLFLPMDAATGGGRPLS